jgi:hypothetical protein
MFQPSVLASDGSSLNLKSHAIVVQVEALEQVVHVLMPVTVIALQSNDDSHPLVGSASLSNLLTSQVTAVHVSLSEHVSQVPPATVGQPTSQPVAA